MNIDTPPSSYKFIAVRFDAECGLSYSETALINEEVVNEGSTLTTSWGMTQSKNDWEYESGGFRLFPTVRSLIENVSPIGMRVFKVFFNEMTITPKGEARTGRVHVVDIMTADRVIETLIESSNGELSLAIKKYMVENDYNVRALLNEDAIHDPDDTLALYCASRGIYMSEIARHPNTKVREIIAEKCSPEERLRACYWYDVEDVIYACLRGRDFHSNLVYHTNVRVRLAAVQTLSHLLKTTAWEEAGSYRAAMLNLSYDDVAIVRSMVAACGYHHDILIHDAVTEVKDAVRRNRNTLGDKISLFFSGWI